MIDSEPVVEPYRKDCGFEVLFGEPQQQLDEIEPSLFIYRAITSTSDRRARKVQDCRLLYTTLAKIRQGRNRILGGTRAASWLRWA